jgi:4-oxalomesaconate hydratase
LSNVLVVTAHPGDFVWRAGGAIALHARAGSGVHVVCLSFGERGESQGRVGQTGATLAGVKAARRREAQAAADVLGASIEFHDAGDYPLVATPAMLDRLVATYRRLRPDFVLTHPAEDPYNLDHPAANRIAHAARIVAQAAGHEPVRRGLSRAAGVSVRAAPDRDERLPPRCAARHRPGVGDQASRLRMPAGAEPTFGAITSGWR